MNCYDPESPEVCDDGSYPYLVDGWLSTDCILCDPGFYCQQGLKEDCPPGTYCPDNGHIRPYQCPAGSFCEGGSQIVPKPCPEKKYSDGWPSEDGWFECKSCPARFFCDGGIKENCPKGRDNELSRREFPLPVSTSG